MLEDPSVAKPINREHGRSVRCWNSSSGGLGGQIKSDGGRLRPALSGGHGDVGQCVWLIDRENGKEPTIAEAEYRSEKPHDPELEKQARDEAIKEAVKQGWTKPT
jgi:hypothetical protein